MGKFCYYSLGFLKPFYPQLVILGILFFEKIRSLSKNKLVSLLIIFSPAILIFIKILRNDPFFLSDDFDHLRLVTEHSYLQIFSQAASSSGIWVGHRIVSGFFAFKLIFDIFSVNIYLYIIATFLLHLLNIFLFFKFISRVLKNRYFSILGSFVFASIYLPWISNIHELLGGTFLLLTILTWIKYLKSGNKKYYYTSFISYLIAILSKEIIFLAAIAMIPMLVFIHVNLFKVSLKKEAVRLLPFLIVSFLYLLFVASGFSSYFGYETSSSYVMSYSLEVVSGNLTHYASLLIPWTGKEVICVVFILVLVLLDLYKKRFLVTPFLFIYMLFQTPSLFFVNRTSLYYLYYPSMFLIPATMIFLKDIYTKVDRKYLRNNLVKRFFVSFFVVFLVFGFFGLGERFMDDCFLMLNPWKNEKKESIYQVSDRISELHKNSKLSKGAEISLEGIKEKDDVINLISLKVLHLFVNEKEYSVLRYNYNPDTDSLYVR
jgi:hypothetical protein